jgi:hypothetical protein
LLMESDLSVGAPLGVNNKNDQLQCDLRQIVRFLRVL